MRSGTCHPGRPEDSHRPGPARARFREVRQGTGLTAGRTALVAAMGTEGHRRSALQQFGRDRAEATSGSTPSRCWQYAFQSRCVPSGKSRAQGQPLSVLEDRGREGARAEVRGPGIRAEVLRAWKLIQARDIALKAAEKLAAEARKADKPLKQVFADRPERHVILPSKFTWLNFPNVANGWQQPARLSAVDGVDMPGWDFMREVFGLEPGQVGVAFNAPKTFVYVVRPTEFTPSYEVLRAQFETEPFGKYAAAGQEDRPESTRRGSRRSRNPPASSGGPATRPSTRPTTPRRAKSRARALFAVDEFPTSLAAPGRVTVAVATQLQRDSRACSTSAKTQDLSPKTCCPLLPRHFGQPAGERLQPLRLRPAVRLRAAELRAGSLIAGGENPGPKLRNGRLRRIQPRHARPLLRRHHLAEQIQDRPAAAPESSAARPSGPAGRRPTSRSRPDRPPTPASPCCSPRSAPPTPRRSLPPGRPATVPPRRSPAFSPP